MDRSAASFLTTWNFARKNPWPTTVLDKSALQGNAGANRRVKAVAWHVDGDIQCMRSLVFLLFRSVIPRFSSSRGFRYTSGRRDISYVVHWGCRFHSSPAQLLCGKLGMQVLVIASYKKGFSELKHTNGWNPQNKPNKLPNHAIVFVTWCTRSWMSWSWNVVNITGCT